MEVAGFAGGIEGVCLTEDSALRASGQKVRSDLGSLVTTSVFVLHASEMTTLTV